MRVSIQHLALSIAAPAVLLAACQGIGGVPTGLSAALQAGSPASPATKIPICSAPSSKVPGTYYILFANGNVKGSTFTSVSVTSSWQKDSVVASPSPKPSPTPTHAAWYEYYGTYSLAKSKEHGCTYLAATVSGKPIFKGLTTNAFADGVPKFEKSVKVKIVGMGQLTETVHGLGASGGTGTVKLTLNGSAIDSGTAIFTGRVLLP